MTQAETLVRRISDDLKTIDQAIGEHPYTQAFRDGSASLEALVPFVGTQYHILNADTGLAAKLLDRIDGDLAAGFVRGFLDGGLASRARLPAMAEQIGMSEADLRAYQPSAEGFAFGAYVSTLFNQGTAAQVMCGLMVNLPAWGHNCDVLGRALRENYDWSRGATAFVDGFAATPDLKAEALPVIEAGLARGESPESIARVARLIQGNERMFWNAVAAEAGHGLIANRAPRKLYA